MQCFSHTDYCKQCQTNAVEYKESVMQMNQMFSKSSLLTLAIDAVTTLFFWTPYPTTTTSVSYTHLVKVAPFQRLSSLSTFTQEGSGSCTSGISVPSSLAWSFKTKLSKEMCIRDRYRIALWNFGLWFTEIPLSSLPLQPKPTPDNLWLDYW